MLYPLILIRRCLMNARNRIMIKRFNRIFSRVITGHALVRLPEFSGEFNIDIRSHIFRRIALFGEYENDVRELLINRLDDCRDAIDIGANIGLFSVVIAKTLSKGRKVLAIEPTPGAISLLQKNIEHNNVTDSILVFQGAVSDHSGSVEIHVTEGNEEYSSIGESIVHESIKGHRSEKVSVDCTTLDALVDKYKLNPGLIKIDVEGAEFLVLEGAKSTLQKYHPVVIFECFDKLIANFAVSFKDITNYFEGMGYRVTALEDNNEYIAEYQNH